MRSIEPGEDWIWCFVDEITAGEVDASFDPRPEGGD
jgi:hypothetical protein